MRRGELLIEHRERDGAHLREGRRVCYSARSLTELLTFTSYSSGSTDRSVTLL